MFKLFTLGVVSLLGMNYSNNFHNNVPILYASQSHVNGGVIGDNVINDFVYIDPYYTYKQYDNDVLTEYPYFTATNYFVCDSWFIKNGNDVYSSDDYQPNYEGSKYNYISSIHYDYRTYNLVLTFGPFSYQWETTTDNGYQVSGMDVYQQAVAHGDFVMHVNGFKVNRYQRLSFEREGYSTILVNNYPSNLLNDKHIPISVGSDLYDWLNYDYEFGSDIFALGYFNYDNSAYYALGYAIQSQASQADNVRIFKGLFKSFDNYYDRYDIQYMQNIDGSQYFGPLGVSSLSDCIHLTNSDYFYPFAGRYHNIGYDDSHGYDYVWYTLYTQIGTSGTVNTAISNVRSFQHPNFSKLHIYYQNKALVNQTRVYAKTYYDLLTYNPNYNVLPGGGSTGNGLQGAFDLLGTAFNKLWQVGNIAVLGSITLNTLILLPLVISLMLFVIHLIKKG